MAASSSPNALSEARWRSSSTSTSGALRALASTTSRQAPSSSSRPSFTPRLESAVARSNSAIRSGLSTPSSLSNFRIRPPGRAGPRSSATPSNCSSSWRDGPYVASRPVGSTWRMAGPAGFSLGSHARNSSTSLVLPAPAGSTMVTIFGSRSCRARSARRLSCLNSLTRPASGIRVGATTRLRRPSSARTATRAFFPFKAASREGPNSNSAADRAVRSPTMISQGWADCCSRAAVLTTSPVTMKSRAVESLVATTSPVVTPNRSTREPRRSESSFTRSRISSVADNPRSASSPWAWFKPNTAITASPTNFSTVPPWASTASLAIS